MDPIIKYLNSALSNPALEYARGGEGGGGGDVNRSNAWDKSSNVWVLYLKWALQDITTFKQLPVIGDTQFHLTNNQMQITLSLKTTAM